MASTSSRSSKVYTSFASLAIALWEAVRYSHFSGLMNNSDFTRERKQCGVTGESVTSMDPDGAFSVYVVNTEGASAVPQYKTLAIPSSFGTACNVNASGAAGDNRTFENRMCIVTGMIYHTVSPSAAMPGGADDANLKTDHLARLLYNITVDGGGVITAMEPLHNQAAGSTPSYGIHGMWYTGPGSADETGDHVALQSIDFGADNRTVAFYVDSSTGYLRMYSNNWAGMAFAFKFDFFPYHNGV